MKVAVLGSTRYHSRIVDSGLMFQKQGNEVRTAFFDSDAKSEIETARMNREVIEWAELVCFLWDGHSAGVVFDMGICFALRKPIKMLYKNKRTLSNLFEQMEVDACE